MTVKELASFTGKNKSTICRWIAKTQIDSITSALHYATQYSPANYGLDEVQSILESGSMSKDAVRILMENARNQNIPATLESTSDPSLIVIANLIESQQKFMAAVMAELKGMNQNPIKKDEIKLISAPAMAPRAELNKLINKYAIDSFGGDRREAWNALYQDIYYRLHKNIRVCAKNAGISKIDYLEENGLIETSASIVIELMGE